MWVKNLDDFAEKDAEEDDVFHLKPGCVIDDDSDSDQPLDTTYECWRKEFKAELISLSVHPAFPEVAHVAVGSCDDTCTIVDLSSQDEGSEAQQTLLGPFEETVSCCAYSPNGAYLSLGCMDGCFLVYSTVGTKYDHMCTVNGPTDGIEWISWLGDSSAVMFGGSGHTVYIWDPQLQTTACVNTTDTNSCGKLCMYGDNALAVLGGDDGHLNIVRYSNGTVGSVSDVPLGKDSVTCVDCHDTVQLAVAGLYDGSLYFVGLTKKSISASFLEDHTDTVEAVKFCTGASSTMAVSCGHDGRVITWDCERMAKLNVVPLLSKLTRMVWVPSVLVVAVSNVRGELYTLKNGKVIKHNRPHQKMVLDLATLPCDDDECALLSVSEDGSMVM
ncbi:WD domain, G-beta repeat domain containing protein, putative [Babesia bigemina]|uniref:WD domain, G-beta repeat domain containing protein, putative n=1 Tax=Babesia bigemina TaxID=5866 RepID=A0A061D5X0_BABBI|nr:WD domain, G-beta repeat domain containing protein, putative [Babesia bigemina]CDR95412.1 WD domain, G-beta repeat domain containing protein, putative [Babesia bigemina]|eukprot:XP_012767598.1 WD domain, G-beta repeat domain containing protein, putative [Babesia bigemina]